MIDFALGEMADEIRALTQRFASDKITPIASEIDREDRFPRELWPQMGGMVSPSTKPMVASA